MNYRKIRHVLFVLMLVAVLLLAACGKKDPTPTPSPEPPPIVEDVQEMAQDLVNAVKEGDVGKVEELLDAGGDPMQMTSIGPLPSVAALGGNPEVISVLDANGADFTALDMSGMPPINIAAMAGHMGAVQQLIGMGMDVNSTGGEQGMTPLLGAIETGDLDMANLLIDSGANVNLGNMNLDTPLLSAVEFGNMDMANLLIGAGADPNAQNLDGFSPLHFAALNDDMPMFDMLAGMGADMGLENNEGLLPFELGEMLPEMGLGEIGEMLPNVDLGELGNLLPGLGGE